MPIDLAQFYADLPPPIEDGDVLSVVALASHPTCRLGRDLGGRPALLVSVGADSALVPPVRLAHLSVQHGVRCALIDSNTGIRREEVVSVVRCTSDEPTLRSCFLRVLALALDSIGPHPTAAELTALVRDLAALFRNFEEPSRAEVQGLWAELFVIANASDPSLLVAAWRSATSEAFDFAMGSDRLEVKSFSGDERRHHFSLRQTRPPPPITAVIVSIKVQRSVGGTTAVNLLHQLRRRGLDAAALLKVELVVAETLGAATSTGLEQAFDLEAARDSLLFFDSATIPSIEFPIHPAIGRVHFDTAIDVDLALSLNDLGRISGVAAAAAPLKR